VAATETHPAITAVTVVRRDGQAGSGQLDP
jgi:hypothetical protein